MHHIRLICNNSVCRIVLTLPSNSMNSESFVTWFISWNCILVDLREYNTPYLIPCTLYANIPLLRLYCTRIVQFQTNFLAPYKSPGHKTTCSRLMMLVSSHLFSKWNGNKHVLWPTCIKKSYQSKEQSMQVI